MNRVCAILLLSFSLFLIPANGFSHHRGSGGHYDGYYGRGYADGHRGHHRDYYGGHRNHRNDNVFWGATGFLVGAALGAAVYPPPVYGYGPPAYYSSPPMCRYDRYVTDPWGRPYWESFVAPCR